jgi:hypothetical protein
MSTPYKRYISSAVCEGISKKWMACCWCSVFFNIPPIYLFILPNMAGIMGKIIKNK